MRGYDGIIISQYSVVAGGLIMRVRGSRVPSLFMQFAAVRGGCAAWPKQPAGGSANKWVTAWAASVQAGSFGMSNSFVIVISVLSGPGFGTAIRRTIQRLSRRIGNIRSRQMQWTKLLISTVWRTLIVRDVARTVIS